MSLPTPRSREALVSALSGILAAVLAAGWYIWNWDAGLQIPPPPPDDLMAIDTLLATNLLAISFLLAVPVLAIVACVTGFRTRRSLVAKAGILFACGALGAYVVYVAACASITAR